MMWYRDDAWGWWWFVMPIVMVGFWLAVAWVVVTLVRRPSASASGGDAERILADRFAHGEIDAEEYRRRLDTLRGERARA